MSDIVVIPRGNGIVPVGIAVGNAIVPEYRASRPHGNVRDPIHDVPIERWIEVGILSHARPGAHSFPRGGIAGGIIRNRSSSPFDPGTKLAMKAGHGLEAPGVGFHIVGERNEALDRSPFAPLFRFVVISLRTAVEMRRQGSLDRPRSPLPLLRHRRTPRIDGSSRMRHRSTSIRRNLFSYDLGEFRWDAIADSVYVLLLFFRQSNDM